MNGGVYACRPVGKRTSYAPGTFSWVYLATTDAAAAKLFYVGLFGWQTEDNDAGGTSYTTCRVGGDAVCGLYEISEDMRAAGVTPNWMSYVTVLDADGVAARTKHVGGRVIDEAFDVLDLGRMAVVVDPQGAVFAVWQPRTRIGAERVNDVGCLCMNELATSDLDGARSFYTGLFGWTTEVVDPDPDEPLIVLARNGERVNASFLAAEGGASPHWRPNFTVESTETAVARIRDLGGTVLMEPVEIFDGSIAMGRDPQGALFSLFAGETDP
jgi:predicted enzyme related to lactoylglutathione lyase